MKKLLVALVSLGLVIVSSQVLAQTTITAKMHADLKHMDPYWTTTIITQNFGYMVYDVLFTLDAAGRIVPQMVGNYEVSRDRMTYTFTLRPELKWSDGNPVRAQDCVASIRRWAKYDAAGGKLLAKVDSLRALNDRTFEMKLKEPYPLVLRALAKVYGIVPFMTPEKVALREAAGGAVEQIIGSGPFTYSLAESRQGTVDVFYKNKLYVPRDEPASYFAGGKRVYVDKVVWRSIPDYATAVAALKRGEIDLAEIVPSDLIPTLRTDPNISVELQGVSQMQIHPNHLIPPFNNVKARQALMLMVKQSDYLRAMAGNDPANWRECFAYLGCGTPLEDTTGMEMLREFNVAKARQLVKESGYGGEPIVVMVPTEPPHTHAASMYTVQMLKEIGFNVNAQTMDWGTLTSRRAIKADPKTDPGGWHIFHTTSGAWALPDPWGHNNISTDCEKGWFGWACSPRANVALAKLAEYTPGTPEFKRQLSEYHAALAENIRYVPVGEFFQRYAYREDRIRDLVQAPYMLFWNVKKK